MNKEKMLYGAIILAIIIISGTLFFHFIEGHTLFDSFYFIMMTMTTVGYGDIVPQSYIGKVFTILYALTGIPIFVFLGGFIVEKRITTLVKHHIKQHTHQVGSIENETIETNDTNGNTVS